MHTDAQLVVGILQLQSRVYTQAGREPSPRGSSHSSRRSALSPTAMPRARESDPTGVGREDFQNSLMAEDGRIELHRVSARLTAYKAASTPNGLRLPFIKAPTRFEGVGEKLVGVTRLERATY